MKQKTAILLVFTAGLSLGYLLALRHALSLFPTSVTLTLGNWSREKPVQTIARLLEEYPQLQAEARGTLQVPEKTVNLHITLRSLDPTASNAFEASGRVEGPWDQPTLHLESLKKKNFKARIHI